MNLVIINHHWSCLLTMILQRKSHQVQTYLLPLIEISNQTLKTFIKYMSTIILLNNNTFRHWTYLYCFLVIKKLIKMEHNDTLLCLEFQSIRNHVDYISKIRMKALHISETMK